MVHMELARPAPGLDLAALGQHIRTERLRQRLSLEALAERAGVSRSMLSEIERGGKVPTIVVLDRIAAGLGSSLVRLLDVERAARVVLLPREQQMVARDPAGWERRILSPLLPGVEFELMRTTIPPGVDAGAFGPHVAGSREYLAVEHGSLRLTVDEASYTLGAGDSIFYAGDSSHRFVNPGEESCVYYLATVDTASPPHPNPGHGPAATNHGGTPA
jgi:transcriptional regulator with XRE-family HTH domain